MKENYELSSKIREIIKSFRPQPTEISFAVIDLNKPEPEIAGYNLDKFIYPASIYKVFIAAEVLRQIDLGQKTLGDMLEIIKPNAVDRDDPRFFTTNIHRDNRPLLKVGDKVSIDYLLDLMLTRSDNTAANVLIDLVERENINKNIILPNGWKGSEVTRKFLNRAFEEENYKEVRGTVSTARVLAEFFYKVETRRLVSPWASKKLKDYLMRWNKDGQSGLYIQKFKNYYRKGGWFKINGYRENFWKAIRSARERGYAVLDYRGDAGVVRGENSYYAVAVLTIMKTKWPWAKFPMKKFAKNIYKLMETQR